MATFQLLQEHCLQHAEPVHQLEPEHSGQILNQNEDQQILIEITDQPLPGLNPASVAQDAHGRQFVVVYDVPTNEWFRPAKVASKLSTSWPIIVIRFNLLP